jgi:uncharacterized protein (DUF2147 family)
MTWVAQLRGIAALRAFGLNVLSAVLCVTILLISPLSSMVANAADTPVGVWKTIDDETGKAKSYIRISSNNGVLEGVIEKILPPGDPDAVCEACDGALKGKPIVGMKILTGMKPGNDGFEGGKILDPNNGKTYKCLLWLEPGDATKLNVRGFIGFSMFGRSQVWVRQK